MSAKILLLDPDKKVHQILTPHLQKTTHTVISVSSGQQALTIVEQQSVDLMVTEITLPDISGFLLISQVKSIIDVIVYTEVTEQELILRAFEEGADDFLSKSVVGPVELSHRVNAILKRRKPGVITVKHIHIDVYLKRVWWKGLELELTRQGFQFLLALVRHPNQIHTRDNLLSAIGSDNFDYRILYVIAYGIRQQIEEIPDNPQYLQNIRGIGYILKI